MKFHFVKAKNFMRFRELDLPLSDQGTVLVLGENKDAPKASSNGAGKSTLLDALCWGLWGQTVRGAKHDAVVNEDVGQDCQVDISFEDDGVTYTVQRTRLSTEGKPNDLRLYVDGVEDSGKSIKATQERVEQILGVDFLTFRCMMPGAGIRVAEMTDTNIKSLLEGLLRTDECAKAQELARSQWNEIKGHLLTLEGHEERLKSKLSTAKLEAEEHQEGIDTFLDKKKLDLDSALDKVSRAELELEGVDAALNKNRERQLSLSVVKLEYQAAQEMHASAQATYTEIHREYSSYADDKIQQRVVSDLQAKIDKFNKLEGECPTCFQQVEESHKVDVLGGLREEKLSAEKLLDEYRLHRQQLADQCTEAEALLDDAAHEAEVARKKEVERQELLRNQERLESELASKEEHLESLRAHAKEIEARTCALQALLQGALQEIERLSAETLETSESIERLTVKRDQLKFWVDGFSSKGIRNYMLEAVTPVLNMAASRYSEILSEGEMSVQFHTKKPGKSSSKNEFYIEVSHKHGASNYLGNSTGERRRGDLVIAFALGDLAQKRASKRIPFRFLDEPFESIDNGGLHAIMALIHDQSQYDTVYCVTHNPALQQLFDKQITVVKEGGISTLVDP